MGRASRRKWLNRRLHALKLAATNEPNKVAIARRLFALFNHNRLFRLGAR